jgi:hypothetical protein
VRAAEFAFFGTVRRLAASNVPQVEPSSAVAVVRADDVILAPASVGDIAGRDLTIRLSCPAPKVGQKALFLGSSWMLGDEIAIVEVARITGRIDRRQLRTAILEEKLRQFDEELLARVVVAAVVVRGRVAALSTIEIPPERRGDEDLAGWQIASVQVLDILKGQPEPTLHVAFLSPRPPRWYDAPIFCEGQEGIWLLRKAAQIPEWEELDGVPEGAYGALHPLDYQAAGLFSRIHALSLLEARDSQAAR